MIIEPIVSGFTFEDHYYGLYNGHLYKLTDQITPEEPSESTIIDVDNGIGDDNTDVVIDAHEPILTTITFEAGVYYGFAEGDVHKLQFLDDDIYDFRETFVHKGKTYEATRACPDGTNMVWEYDWSSVWEVGCMSTNERDNYARELMQRKRQKANRMFQDSLKNFSNTINPPTTRCSTYGSGSSFNTTCKQY